MKFLSGRVRWWMSKLGYPFKRRFPVLWQMEFNEFVEYQCKFLNIYIVDCYSVDGLANLLQVDSHILKCLKERELYT